MKKITLIAIALSTLSFISCKKDRTCTCTSTPTSQTNVTAGVSNVNYGPFSSTENTFVMTKVTKKGALANCASGEDTQVFTDISNGDTQTTVYKKDCELK